MWIAWKRAKPTAIPTTIPRGRWRGDSCKDAHVCRLDLLELFPIYTEWSAEKDSGQKSQSSKINASSSKRRAYIRGVSIIGGIGKWTNSQGWGHDPKPAMPGHHLGAYRASGRQRAERELWGAKSFKVACQHISGSSLKESNIGGSGRPASEH